MSNKETQRLLEEVMAVHRQFETVAASLANEELTRPVPMRTRTNATVRTVLYIVGNHAREHTVHLKKLLQATGAPGARPSEAQHVLEQAGEAMGAFQSAFARITDADLDREYEDQTPRKILEHMKSAYDSFLQNVRGPKQ